jgi:hypothetical protein
MARAQATEISDSENEVVSSPKNKSTSGKQTSMAEGDLSEEQVDEGSDAGSAEGSEYEIESIITAKRSGSVSFYLCFLMVLRTRRPSLIRHGRKLMKLFLSRLAGFHISSQLERI